MEMAAEAANWAAKAVGLGTQVQNARRLMGSTSSTLYALDITRRSITYPCVLRFYDADYLASEPDAPEHEAAALQVAFQAGLPAPELIAVDPDGSQSGSPALLMTRLLGSVVLVPRDMNSWLHTLAAALLPVHSVSAEGFPWRFRPYADVFQVSPPLWSRRRQGWEQAIAFAQGPVPPAPECFIHRDYHPNNVLWQNRAISGIVDWPGACLGTANADVAWCRHNLFALYGVSAADGFLTAYQRLAGPSFTYHPYWDLLALMESCGPMTLYPPWAEHGKTDLTVELLCKRTDEFLESVLRRL